MWSPIERTWVFPALSAMIFCGPFLSPVFADLIATSTLSWHWIEWITLIAAGVVLSLITILLPETYAPIILGWKAAALRDATGSSKYRGPQDRQTTFIKRTITSTQRPWLYLSQEPIVICLSLYLVLIYCILFGFLPGFNYIFGTTASHGSAHGVYEWPQRITGLSFLPMNIGFLLALVPLYWIYARYKRQVATGSVRPEERLIYAMIGAPLLPVSILLMAYIAKPNISFWCPLVASGVFGFASITIFISCYQYVIDAYEERCSSALVGMTVTRYVAAGTSTLLVPVTMFTDNDQPSCSMQPWQCMRILAFSIVCCGWEWLLRCLWLSYRSFSTAMDLGSERRAGMLRSETEIE